MSNLVRTTILWASWSAGIVESWLYWPGSFGRQPTKLTLMPIEQLAIQSSYLHRQLQLPNGTRFAFR